MGERELCKLEAIGSIPFTSTNSEWGRYDGVTLMKKAVALLCALFVLGAGGAAFAACTPDEAQARADLVSKRISEVAPKDPPKAVAVAQEVAIRIPEFQKNPKGYDIEGLCRFYDDMLDKLK